MNANPGRFLPGDRIRVIDGTFVGAVGSVVTRADAFALWEKVGGQKPGPIDPVGAVWVAISVFDRVVPVLLDGSQIEACGDT
jgi:transcription antitermination factor NusG